jgi:type I restriction enzyme, R subunit
MAVDDSYIPPEQKARRLIDAMLNAAGWVVQDYKAVNQT